MKEQKHTKSDCLKLKMYRVGNSFFQAAGPLLKIYNLKPKRLNIFFIYYDLLNSLIIFIEENYDTSAWCSEKCKSMFSQLITWKAHFADQANLFENVFNVAMKELPSCIYQLYYEVKKQCVQILIQKLKVTRIALSSLRLQVKAVIH